MNDAQMPKLLPCPFCGGEAKVYGPVGWYRQYGISHSCSVFYGGSGDFTLGANSEGQAIADWNLRADLCGSGQQVREGMRMAADIALCHSDDRPRRYSMDWNDGYIDGCRGASDAILAEMETLDRATRRASAHDASPAVTDKEKEDDDDF